MENTAAFGAKENEMRQKENEAQQQIQVLERQTASLTATIKDEMNKCDRIRKIARKYKESGKLTYK